MSDSRRIDGAHEGRRGRRWATFAGVAMIVLLVSSCGGGTEPNAAATTALPMQEAGLVLEEGVEQQAEKVAEYPISEQELEEIAEECADAQGVPLGGDDPCLQVMEFRFDPDARACGRFAPCLEVYSVEAEGFAASGYLQISDPRPRHSLCSDAADALCLRVGVEEPAIEHLASAAKSQEPSAEASSEPKPEPSESPDPGATQSPDPEPTASPVTETPAPAEATE